MTIDEEVRKMVINDEYLQQFVLDDTRYKSNPEIEKRINSDLAKLNGGVIEINYPKTTRLHSFFSNTILPYLSIQIYKGKYHFKADDLSLMKIKGIMGSRTVDEVEGTEKEYVLRRYDKVA